MLETEIKKLREQMEQSNKLLVDLIQMQSQMLKAAVPLSEPAEVIEVQPETVTQPETAAAPPPEAAAPQTPPQAAPSATPPTAPAATPPAAAPPTAGSPPPATTPATPPTAAPAPGPTGALTELGAYAIQLVAQYSAKTGNPAEVMTITQKYGILDVNTATDEQLSPLVVELKQLLGIQ